MLGRGGGGQGEEGLKLPLGRAGRWSRGGEEVAGTCGLAAVPLGAVDEMLGIAERFKRRDSFP